MTKTKIEDVVNYLENHTWKQTAQRFYISEMTISRYLKKFKMRNTINNDNYIKLLKRGFNKLLKKRLDEMKAAELKLVYFLITNKSVSLRKEQYITKLTKIIGVNKFGF